MALLRAYTTLLQDELSKDTLEGVVGGAPQSGEGVEQPFPGAPPSSSAAPRSALLLRSKPIAERSPRLPGPSWFVLFFLARKFQTSRQEFGKKNRRPKNENLHMHLPTIKTDGTLNLSGELTIPHSDFIGSVRVEKKKTPKYKFRNICFGRRVE